MSIGLVAYWVVAFLVRSLCGLRVHHRQRGDAVSYKGGVVSRAYLGAAYKQWAVGTVVPAGLSLVASSLSVFNPLGDIVQLIGSQMLWVALVLFNF